MVTLPAIEEYASAELARARELSPAFARYERLIADPEIPGWQARRHRAWMRAVLATYFRRASTPQICEHWSACADELLREAWLEAGIEDAVLIAVGKHGARELNLSSDIDVMVIAAPGASVGVEKALRAFRARVHEPGRFGFGFRLDFDLRPGGRHGPIVTTPEQFQDHYWTQGETWERLALVRLRAVAGDPALANLIEDLARKFSYRKYLDFTLLEDLKALRTRVHQEGFKRRPEELHLKLEVGGIRDIELFAHSLLVLNGGKAPGLQTRSTDGALTGLAANGIMDPDDARTLVEGYWRLRHAENWAQSLEDRQTHSVPRADAGELTGIMERVDSLVSTLLGAVDLARNPLPVTAEAQREWLMGLGFTEPAIEASWTALVNATALSYRNERDERARLQFLFMCARALAPHADRDQGLATLLDFVRGTRSKATFFSMLLRTPRLIEDLARLFCLSPYLGAVLAARPELLDHFVLRVDEPWSNDPERLGAQMSERKLLTEIWSSNRFLEDGDLDALTEQATLTADQCARELLRHLRVEFPMSKLGVVALGKWGGRELGLRSDLDFMFVAPAAPVPDDFKVARRFISRSSYDVDLRLRPSGQSGPLLVALERLNEYLRYEAQAWERQAYLRARAITGGELAADRRALFARALSPADLHDLAEIRRKLLNRDPGTLDLKYAPGGLIDLEFSAQIARLATGVVTTSTATLEFIAELGWPTRVAAIYRALRRREQMLQLVSARRIGSLGRNERNFAKLSQLLKIDPDRAWEETWALLRESCAHLNRLDVTKFERPI